LLDEDLNVESVHELDGRGLSDREQRHLAAAEGRIFVARNRDDYIALTVEFYGTGEPHNGVLIVPRVLANNRPERIAHTLKRWVDTRTTTPEAFDSYHLEFLSQ
jgi:Domain of unknown function (DUF5615)